jgi:Kef-type K+ transport system membrane component KefB
LLLFEVGLEIDLPAWRDFRKAMGYGTLWALGQYPLVFLLAVFAGMNALDSLLAAVVLTGCSVGMAHLGWKHYGYANEQTQSFILNVLVALEMNAIILLSLYSMAEKKGISWWVPFHLLAILLVIWLVSRFASHVKRLIDVILQTTTHWRIHLIVLIVLAVCAIGERLGLSSVKTAFFLGLFMSRTQHEGSNVEDSIAPISQRFLIPLFFVGLGLRIGWRPLAGMGALLPLGASLILLGFREILPRRWLPSGGDGRTFLLFGPNLTIVALGVSSMIEGHRSLAGATWLLLCGFFVSVFSILFLPAREADGQL